MMVIRHIVDIMFSSESHQKHVQAINREKESKAQYYVEHERVHGVQMLHLNLCVHKYIVID